MDTNKEDYLVLDTQSVNAIGNLSNKKGYQRVKLNLEYLKQAIDILENQSNKYVILFVKKDYPIQIGKEKIGVIIAPVVKTDYKKEVK